MKKILLAFIIAILSTTANAQLPDSISRRMDHLRTFDEQVRFLDQLSTQMLRSNLELYRQIVERGVALAELEKNDSIQYRFQLKMGTYFTYKDQLDTARQIFQSILNSPSVDSLLKASLFTEIAVTYYYEANDRMALEYFIKAYQIVKYTDDKAKLAQLSNNLGVIYQGLKDYEQSKKFFNEALRYKMLLGDSMSFASTIHNIGINFKELRQMDSALHYFRHALALRLKFNDLRGQSTNYRSISILLFDLDDIDSSLFYISKAIEIDRKLGDKNALADDLAHKAKLLWESGSKAEIETIANEALSNSDYAPMQKEIFRILADLYLEQSKYQLAAHFLNQYATLTDSIHLAEKEASVNELRFQFDVERKDNEIARLEQENVIRELQAEQDAQLRILFILLTVAFIVISLLLWLGYRNKSKVNKLLDTKNQELAAINRTKDRLFSIISHDLKSPLSSFHLITQSLADNIELIDKAQMRDYLGSLRDSSANVRDMMDNLLKWALTQTDQLNLDMKSVELKGVIDEVIGQLEVITRSKSIAITTKLDEHINVEGDASFLEIVLRNLLSNSLKFTPSGRSISIESGAETDYAVLRIIDEGVGMHQRDIDKLLAGEIIGQEIQNSSEKGTGLGVTLVKELVIKMGGKINVITAVDQGTTFEIYLRRAA